MDIHEVAFKNNLNQTLKGFVHEPKKYQTAVLLLHGFPGTCERSTQKKAIWLSRIGYLAMRFDFSGTGNSEGTFENKLMSQEANDIKFAIDYLKDHYRFKKLVVFGHSTGAIDISLYAHTDDRIDAIIVSGGVYDLKKGVHYDFNEEQIEQFKKQGYMIYDWPDSWCDGFKLKRAFYDEFFKLNIPQAIKKFKKEMLILHGEKDEGVPVFNARKLYHIANSPKELVIIPRADHSFKKGLTFFKMIWAVHGFIKHHVSA